MRCPRSNFCTHYHFLPENCDRDFDVVDNFFAIVVIIDNLLPKVVGVDMSFLHIDGNNQFVIDSSDS